MSETLVQFLSRMLDADEAAARAAVQRSGERWRVRGSQRDEDGESVVYSTSHINTSTYGDEFDLWDSDGGCLGTYVETAAHIARWDPARVLAEIEVRRTIANGHHGWHVCPNITDSGYTDYCDQDDNDDDLGMQPCPTLRLLVAPYSDEPGFDPSWSLSYTPSGETP